MHLLVPLLVLAQASAEPFPLKSGDTVLFLGDSNTFAGGYIAQIDAVLRTKLPNEKFNLINLGLPSETCSGLTEKDHPFPRPDVHERLDRALAEIKPNVVFICYGMNDGIYHPFAEDRFKAYQAGIKKLLEKVRAAKARPILLTPSPFDAVPLKDRTRPETADDFSYKAPFVGYDGVLRRYADWLLTLRDKDLPVIDVHAAVTRYIAGRRKTEPAYTLARDGIHPDAIGHSQIAGAILGGLTFPPAQPALATLPGKATEYKLRPVVGPVPFGTLLLTVEGVPPGKMFDLLVNGQVLATLSSKDLTGGYDLGTLAKFPPAERGKALLEAIRKQHGVLDLALLTTIGHKRPQTPVGIAIDTARKQAAELETTIAALAAPSAITLELRPR